MSALLGQVRDSGGWTDAPLHPRPDTVLQIVLKSEWGRGVVGGGNQHLSITQMLSKYRGGGEGRVRGVKDEESQWELKAKQQNW